MSCIQIWRSTICQLIISSPPPSISFLCLEALSPYRRMAADIASWWRDGVGYDGETLVSLFISFILVRNVVHDDFHHFIMVAAGRRRFLSASYVVGDHDDLLSIIL